MTEGGPRYTAQVVWVTSPELAGELRYWAAKEEQRLSAFLRWAVRTGLVRARRTLHAAHGQPVWREVEQYAQASASAGKAHAQLGWMDEPAFVGELRYWAGYDNISFSAMITKVITSGWPSVRARLVRKHGEPAPGALDDSVAYAISQNKWARFRRGDGPDPRLSSPTAQAS